MKCPFCGNNNTQVIDSREIEQGMMVRRRRKCNHCGMRFTTYESFRIIVIKKDGREEFFDKNKIINGLTTALKKRNVTKDQISKIADEIEEEIKSQGKTRIASKEIGLYILRKLKDIDKVAYVRFASVYFEFKDIEEFSTILKELSINRKRNNENK